MVLACVFFGAMHVGVRHVTQSVHPFEAAFFRNLFGLLVLVPSFAVHGLRPLRTGRFGLHCARAALNVVAMLSFFYALSITPVVLVQALAFTSPLFTAVLAVLLLGERMRARRLTAIVIRLRRHPAHHPARRAAARAGTRAGARIGCGVGLCRHPHQVAGAYGFRGHHYRVHGAPDESDDAGVRALRVDVAGAAASWRCSSVSASPARSPRCA